MTQSESSTPDETAGLGQISDVARIRRQEARPSIQIQQPDYVLDLSRSEVSVTFNPTAIPLAQCDPADLVRRVQDAYGATLGELDLTPLLTKIPRDQLATMDVDQLIQRLCKLPEGTLEFVGGKFPVDRHNFVPISSIDINFETIVARVDGVSAAAELIVSEVAEMIWASAGVTKRFDELSGNVLLRGYATATLVDLGFPTEELLSPALRDFVRDDVLAEGGLIGAMGPSASGPEQKSFAATGSIDELHLMFKKFDLTSGRTSQSLVQFSVIRQSDYGTGRVRISSSLSYVQHLEFIELLRNHVLQVAAE